MMHQDARDGLFDELAHAAPEQRDQLLDRYLKWRDGATEWDADQWGLDPDNWMLELRQLMERRARP